MNLPVGELIQKGVQLKMFSMEKIASGLGGESFSGYIIATVEGPAGMEESLFLFRNGELTACYFEFLKTGEKLFGESAFKLCLNAFRAVYGIVDVVGLSKQQAELVVAFNDKMSLPRPVQPKDLSRLMPSNYDVSLSAGRVSDKGTVQQSRFDILKKIGLKEF